MNMLCRGYTEISRNLSKQPFSTGSGRVTFNNSLRDYFHLLKSPNFRLLVLKYAGSYSRVFTVFNGDEIDSSKLIIFCFISEISWYIRLGADFKCKLISKRHRLKQLEVDLRNQSTTSPTGGKNGH